MTVQTLYTAATGMEALETKLDVIANNMANINTTGFKKDRANFEDVFYRQYRLPGATDGDGNITS
ncbi:MAG TPA: flagellar basal body protein, partial [Lacipirellulaceae bacterium]|nr:flagellar basal body protein [Lacipirellulaceae bacterium]